MSGMLFRSAVRRTRLSRVPGARAEPLARPALLPPPSWREAIESRSVQTAAASTSNLEQNHAGPVSRRARIQALVNGVEEERGVVSPFLVDSFGRKHDYLRISLTEKCNLRCTYCMPEQGVPLLPKEHILTREEIYRMARMFVLSGVTKIRLTGGEPTVRRDLVEIIQDLSSLKPLGLESIGMTTNAVALSRKLPALVAAGLTGLNISLDTLDPFKFELMTRRRGWERVLSTIEEATRYPELAVKVNCVVVRGVNDMEVPAFVGLTKDKNLTVRFIEYMPFEDNRWSDKKLVPASELVDLIKANGYPSLEKMVDPVSDTTRTWNVPGFRGKFGFISSMTDHFCGGCSRLRVGADGGVKVCLFGPPVLSLRPLLRAGDAATDEALILPQIGKALYGKKFAHNGLGGPEGIAKNGTSGPMVAIGGTHSFSDPPQGVKTDSRASREAGRARRRDLQMPWLAMSTMDRLAHARLFSTSTVPRALKPTLTHIDSATGKPKMVSVTDKAVTTRTATATGRITLNELAFSLIRSPINPSSPGSNPKGDVLTIAQLAGIMGAKQTSSLIPLCHPLPLTHVAVSLELDPATTSIVISCTAECHGKTGVEMEALTGATVAGLTVWDMCKAVAGKEMVMSEFKVVGKSGGKSGDWTRDL